MALYVIDINEKSEKGRQLKRLLTEKKSAMKIYSIGEYEKQEELALMKIMRKPLKEELVSAAEIRNTLAKVKKAAFQMIVKATNRFIRDLEKIRSTEILDEIDFTLNEIELAKSHQGLAGFKGFKKIPGF